MSSQWEYLLKNLGEWQGSFTSFSPQGQELEDIPTIVSLEGVNNNQTIRQLVRRLPPNQPANDKVFEYSSLARGVLFCDNGAFSQGSWQWAPFSEFGAELGLINHQRRLRLVQIFNRESKLNKITLIREKLAGTNESEKPALRLDQLLGEWQGEAVTIYPNWQPEQKQQTYLKIEQESEHKSIITLIFGEYKIHSTAINEPSRLYFADSPLPVQILLLPDGASCNCPLEIKGGFPFVLEVGWLINSNYRERLVRSYNSKGEWVSLTLVQETKI